MFTNLARAFSHQKRFFPALLLAVSLSLSLSACSSNIILTDTNTTVTQTAAAPNTVTSSTTTAAPNTVTSSTTTIAVATTRDTTNAASTVQTVETTAAQPIYKPVIWFSAKSIKIGDSVTIGGAGYPPNTGLMLKPSQNGKQYDEPFATPVTDGNGNFSTKVKFEFTSELSMYKPGQVMVQVLTQDGKLGASAPLSLESNGQPNYQPNLTASVTTVAIGGSFNLQGSNYPPNTQVKVMCGVQNPGLQAATLTTDDKGGFNYTMTVGILPNGSNYQPGPFTFVVITLDNKLGSGVTVNLK